MRSIRRIRFAVLAAVSLVLVSPGPSLASATERYYVLIFGSQSQPKLLRYTHTWATFIRAVGEGSDPNGYTLYHHTISWLPQTLEVRVWAPFPEPGVNLDLYETLRAVAMSDQRASGLHFSSGAPARPVKFVSVWISATPERVAGL